MEKISYDRLITEYHDRAVSNKELTSCMFDITYRCTNNCIHCYCVQDNNVQSDELQTEKIKEILKELKESGCLWLTFSGGEPFLRNDFVTIYKYAKQLGFIVSILTNATLITEDIADMLQKYKPIKVSVSIYGSSKEKYEQISRVPGSFERFVHGIELLKNRGINTQLQTILMSVNEEDLDNIQKFSETHGFGYCKFDPFLFNDIDDEKKSYSFRVSPESICTYELKDETRYSYWMAFSQKVNRIGLRKAEKPLDCCSTCGISKVHIDPYGNMMGCNLMRQFSVNLNSYPFETARKILKEKILDAFSKKYSSDHECSNCKIRYLCNCCPGVSYIENRDLVKKSAYACDIAHARKELLHL